MENTEVRSKLMAVASKLNELEVKGEQNMMIVLSCIKFLREMSDDVVREDEKPDE